MFTHISPLRLGPLVAVLLFAIARTTPAQQKGLTLGEVYAWLTASNPQLAAARSLATAAELRVSSAKRPPDPQLQLGWMNYTLPSLAPMPAVGMVQLQLMQMLPLGGKLRLAASSLSAKASAERHRSDELSWELRAKAAMQFYDIYAARRALEVDRETIRLLEDIEKTASSMYRVGEGRQTDVLRAQVEIARMSEDTLRMQSMLVAMNARLKALLDTAVEAELGDPSLPRFPAQLPEAAWLDSMAMENRPMIRAGLAEVTGAEAARRLAGREIWPDLQVGVQYGQRGGEMGTERMASLMLGASIPIFARDRQYRMRDETAAMRAMAEADVAAMRADTRARIAEARVNLSRAKSLTALYQTTILPQAEAMAASALAAYRVGTVDFMTLLDARMALNRFRRERFALLAEEGKAWAELEMLVARDLVDTGGGQ